MFSPRISKKWAGPSACLGLFVHLSCIAEAQNFSLLVTNPDPLGLGNIVPGGEKLDFGLTDGIKGDFGYGIGVHSVFDSNFFLEDNGAKSELVTNFSPWLSYQSDPEGGAPFSFAANYLPTYRMYDHNPDLNGLDNTGDISLRLEGAKTLITAYARYTEVSGTDRLTGGFVSGSLITAGVQASHQVAPRTFVSGLWSVAMSDYGSSTSVGSDIYTAQLGGYWAATERLSFGPSLRYILTESDNIGSREAWSLSMQARYRVGERIRLQGSLGLERATSSGEDQTSTIGLTGELSADYGFNERWAWFTAIRYATVPSPTEAGYVVNNLQISSGLDHHFLRSTVGVGVDYNLSSYESVGATAVELSDENNLSLYISYRRNILSERVAFDSKLRYTMNDGIKDWDQIQLTAGVLVTF